MPTKQRCFRVRGGGNMLATENLLFPKFLKHDSLQRLQVDRQWKLK